MTKSEQKKMEKETAIFMIQNGWTPRPGETVPPEKTLGRCSRIWGML